MPYKSGNRSGNNVEKQEARSWWPRSQWGCPRERSQDQAKFDRHRFVPGEYVSITEHDGVQRTFFIKAVVTLP